MPPLWRLQKSMPCYRPLCARLDENPDGSNTVSFPYGYGRAFYDHGDVSAFKREDGYLQVPCGQCVGCRLENSRQWAVRCVNEAQMHEYCSFITLTYRPDPPLGKPDLCVPVDFSLDHRHFQDFMKRLRDRVYHDKECKKFLHERLDRETGKAKNVRYLMCGEYGDTYMRPHYHAILFNCDFQDKELLEVKDGCRLYTSKILSELWPFGYSTIGSMTFQSAAYVARYSMKKVTGSLAEDHYRRVSPVDGREYQVKPEYAKMSRNPGIGSDWFDKYWKSDIYENGYMVVNGHKCSPPRYYDKKLKNLDLELYETLKARRIENALQRADDNSFKRLLVKEECRLSKVQQLIRTLD